MDHIVWEKSLIGTILADPKTMIEAEVLIPSDFTGANQIIWAEMMSLSARDGLDMRSLGNAVQTSPDYQRVLSDVGSFEEYLADVLRMRGTSVGEYVDRVLDNATKKAIRRNAALIAAEADNDYQTAQELLDYAEKTILSIRRNRTDQGMTMADLFGMFIPRLDGYIAGTIKPAWEPNTQAFKDIIHFAEETEFITIAGRPGDGKSSYLRFEAYKMAQEGNHVLMFNMENDPSEYARHFLALHTGVDSAKLKNPRTLSPDELFRVKEAAEELMRMPLTIMTMPSPSVHQITQVARRKIAETQAKMICVDYIQLIRNGQDNRVQDISETTGVLRGLALQMHVPVLAAAQLSREIERRGVNAEPQLADLRDSGSIEQDSTIVTFLRQFWSSPTHPRASMFSENLGPNGRVLPRLKAIPVAHYVLKNRNGEIGTSTPIKWLRHVGRFETLALGTQVT